MSIKIDLTGQRFGKLVAIESSESNKYGKRLWTCQCDCGNMMKAITSELKRGAVKSCGCYNRESSSKRKLKPRGEANRNRTYKTYIKNSERRGISFDLTIEQAEVFFQGNCYYCGVKPSNVYRKTEIDSGDYTYNGIDRVDSNSGYSASNCVSCCKYCNFAKLNRTQKEFTEWVDRLFNNLTSIGLL